MRDVRDGAVPLPDPDVTPGGVWGALLTGLGAALGGLGVWLRGRKSAKEAEKDENNAVVARLDRIEAALDVLSRTLIVQTEDGGRVPMSRRLADTVLQQLGERLGRIESLLNKRTAQLAELNKAVVTVSEDVRSVIDTLGDRPP